MDTYYTKFPLRVVVEIITKNNAPWEVYECGHGYWAPMNPYSGVKKAKRRRCHKCAPPEAGGSYEAFLRGM
jgi:hypothetical protein